MKKTSKNPILKLKGPTAVYIDWANVYGWHKSIKQEVNPKKLLAYLQTYSHISTINFYFGTDSNLKSKTFLKHVKHLGYEVLTKPVKHILVAKIHGEKIFKRKCDFDVEICIDVFKALQTDVQSFIFFSGDGDFTPLYQHLISCGKQVIVIYARRHIGKEIWSIKQGLYKLEVSYLVNKIASRKTRGKD